MPSDVRIENDTVVKIFTSDPTGNFHPSFVWTLASGTPEIGMVSDGHF